MITRTQLKTLHKMTREVTEATELVSELIRTAQDRHKNTKHTLDRDGKTIELAESVLWEEVFYLGTGSQAGKILETVHPEVFEAYRKQDAAAIELKKFCMLELGVDFTKLSLSDYLMLTEDLFTMLIDEKMGSRNRWMGILTGVIIGLAVVVMFLFGAVQANAASVTMTVTVEPVFSLEEPGICEPEFRWDNCTAQDPDMKHPKVSTFIPTDTGFRATLEDGSVIVYTWVDTLLLAEWDDAWFIIDGYNVTWGPCDI